MIEADMRMVGALSEAEDYMWHRRLQVRQKAASYK